MIVHEHHASGAPALAFRIECEGKVIAYSGDTEWTDSLVSAARDADLFIVEAYFYEKRVKYHLDYRTLIAHLQESRATRFIVTHMSEDMLARVAALGCEYAGALELVIAETGGMAATFLSGRCS
jgi:ribonuclease BN (tRNA processing enzyme)